MNPHATPEAAIADRPGHVAVASTRLLGRGYRDYERFELQGTGGRVGARVYARDVLRGGRVASVLPFDPARGEIVLIRQFRVAAHLANGRGEMIEIVAGRVEESEDVATTARRECREEIGIEPKAILELFTFLPTPGLTDEQITLFLGIVDATRLPERAGAAAENEETIPFRVPVEAALHALAEGGMQNGNLIIALQWLALNRHRLDEFARAAA